MAIHSHHGHGDDRLVSAAADCSECRPAEDGTRQARRVLFFVCAGADSVVARTAERIKRKPPCGVGVEVTRPENVREALLLARGDFSGDQDRVVVVIDFDPGGQGCLEAAKKLALSYPVLAFFATEEGGAAQLAFVRAIEEGGSAALGRFDTCQLGTGRPCHLRAIRDHLESECKQ